MESNLYRRVESILLEEDPLLKCSGTLTLYHCWLDGGISRLPASPLLAIDQPGFPQTLQMVDPRNLSRRSTFTEAGRISLAHAIAHIEFNAINIALDAVYRFREMPEQFVSDWLLVASEEARHFSLLNQYLSDHSSFYGACEVHSGLWDMVCKTRHDVLHRIAMVPRVMEARGLDVTPAMIERFNQVGDHQAVDILEEIYADEIGHVLIGNYWYRYLCDQREVDANITFQALVKHYLAGRLRGPFNVSARLEAGFNADELEWFERNL